MVPRAPSARSSATEDLLDSYFCSEIIVVRNIEENRIQNLNKPVKYHHGLRRAEHLGPFGSLFLFSNIIAARNIEDMVYLYFEKRSRIKPFTF